MAIPAGTYRFGPDTATLAVRTGRSGAAAKAGHDLLFHVGIWQATLDVGDETTLELTADGGSLQLLEGTGGMQALGDDDKAEILKTVDEEVLKGQPISFRSTNVRPAEGGGIRVTGDLTLLGRSGPLNFDVTVGEDGHVRATTVIKQTDWKLKPYSAFWGALKVADDVAIELDAAALPAPSS